MSENFPYGDIIILALIAGFILLRLRSILGQKNDDSFNFFQPPKEKGAGSNDPIIQLADKSLKVRPRVAEQDAYTAKLAEGVVLQGINEIKAKDPLFTASTFLEGAKMAFEMVFDGFNKGDKQVLSMLLSPEIYNDFASDIEARSKQEHKQETTLLSVSAKDITSISLDKNVARIKVNFESEQVTVERDGSGSIIAGDPSDVKHVHDEWVFERDITSKSPNWKIIET